MVEAAQCGHHRGARLREVLQARSMGCLHASERRAVDDGDVGRAAVDGEGQAADFARNSAYCLKHLHEMAGNICDGLSVARHLHYR